MQVTSAKRHDSFGVSGLAERIGSRLPRRIRKALGLKQCSNGKIKRYISTEHGLEPFFVALRERGVRYLVLRWFDELPAVRADGDVDLLIHDDDVNAIDDLFLYQQEEPSIHCDLYSVSGLPGTQWRGMAYLPSGKAAGMLERAIPYRDIYRVPSAEDYFLSLAYHIVYQKGLKTALPASKGGSIPGTRPDHDYAGHLRRLADELGIEVAIDMESLDEFLAERGWRPTPHILARLARTNPWVAARFDLELPAGAA